MNTYSFNMQEKRNIFFTLDGILFDFTQTCLFLLEKECGEEFAPLPNLRKVDWERLQKKNNSFLRNLPIYLEATKLVSFVQNVDNRFNVRFITFVPPYNIFPSAEEDRVALLKTPYVNNITPEILSYKDFKNRHKLYKSGDIVIDSDKNIIAKINNKDVFGIYYQISRDLEDLNNVIRKLGPFIENEVMCGRA